MPAPSIARDIAGSDYDLGLTANLVCRVILGVLAILTCWVPMRLLWMAGELAATVFIIDVMLINFFQVVNSMIWHNDNTARWWHGAGWCDVQTYIALPLQALYGACVCAIMRHVANQVGLMRVNGPTASEKRRRNMVQALIIFPIPVLQIALTYPVLTSRYLLSTLEGCTVHLNVSWPTLVFFILPTPIYTIAAGAFAGKSSLSLSKAFADVQDVALTYFRFKKVEETTQAVMNSGNSSVASRGVRIRRKLYMMSCAILVPFLPLQVAYLYWNIASGPSWTEPYDFNAIHQASSWDDIELVTTAQMSFVQLNQNYIAVLTAVPIFWFFGMTKDAVNTYRHYLVAIGFGRLFPQLRDQYDPDTPQTSRNTLPARAAQQSDSLTSLSSGKTRHSHREVFMGTLGCLSTAIGSSQRTGPSSRLVSDELPLWDLSGQTSGGAQSGSTATPRRKPWIFRTSLVSFRLSIRSLIGSRADTESKKSKIPVDERVQYQNPTVPGTKHGVGDKGSDIEARLCSLPKASVDTRVWSAREACTGPTAATEEHREEQSGVRVETHISTSRRSLI